MLEASYTTVPTEQYDWTRDIPQVVIMDGNTTGMFDYMHYFAYQLFYKC